LIYEVVWQRMLCLVFGNTTFAVATILCSFMGGLALGSLYFGKRADSCKNPLRFFSYLELGVGVFALFFPLALSGISVVYRSLPLAYHQNPSLVVLVKFTLCFLVLLVPAFLMGGTLPALAKVFVRTRSGMGRDVGRLYGINTLGGAFGGFLAGFFLIKSFGVHATTMMAAVVNIVVGLIAWRLNREVRRGEPEEKEAPLIPSAKSFVRVALLAVYAFSGFCALAYEVLWTRMLTFVLHNSTYAFTIILTSFLVGSALGSFLLGALADIRKQRIKLLAFTQIFIGIFAILSVWEFIRLDAMTMALTEAGGRWLSFVEARYAVSFAVMFAPTFLLGVAFPLVTRIIVESFQELGRTVGTVYAANASGCVLGAFAAGFLIIPFVGISQGVLLVAFLNLILGLLCLACDALVGNRPGHSGIAAISLFAGAMVLMTVAPTIELQRRDPSDKLIFYREGASATAGVIVRADGTKVLSLNGIEEVPTEYSAMRTFSLLGHLPCLLHKDPKEALVVCFGAGIASGAMARHPLRHIDVVEISPEAIAANVCFLKENQAVLADPRVNLVLDDARSFLLTTDKAYDVISCDATHPRASDSYVLYTREFYELCRKRLSPDGIMCQWVPLHAVPESEYKRILKTFQSVFPQAMLMYANDRFTLLVGVNGELAVDFTLLAERLGDKTISGDLSPFYADDPFALLRCFVMGPESLARYTGAPAINTDDRPHLQFSREPMNEETTSLNLRGLIDFLESPAPLLTHMGEQSEEVKARLAKGIQSQAHVMRAEAYRLKGAMQKAVFEYRQALAIDPDDNNARHLLGRIENPPLN
jgi:spermidine synthase